MARGAGQNKRWYASCFGWCMVIEASTKRDAQAIANRSVWSFGGIVGVDRAYVREATDEDLAAYEAMGGSIQ